MKTNRLRSIMFIFLLISFTCVTSFVLFMTLGYRFNFERGIFVYTGSISIKTTPDAVNVLIDGKTVPQGRQNILNGSIHLGGIDPGEHLLEIAAPGYRSWTKKVTVSSGISTEFWNIILAKDTLQPDTLLTGPFVKAFPSPDGKFLALFGKTDKETTLTIYEKSTRKAEQIFSSKGFSFNEQLTENLEWSADGKRLIFPLFRGTERHYFLVDRTTLGTEDMTGRFALPDIRLVRWDPKSTGSVLFLSGDSLSILDTADAANTPQQLADGIATYDLSKNTIFTLERETGIIYQSDLGDTIEPDPITQPIGIPFTDPTLIAYDKDRIAVYEKGGKGILFNKGTLDDDSSFTTLGDSLQSLQFSNDGKKLLIATGDELSVLFTRNWDVQPNRSEGDRFQIVRLSTAIASAQWTRDYEHVLFVTGGTLELAELDQRDHRNIFTLLSGIDPLQILSDFQGNTIAIIDRHDAGNSLLSFVFPKPLTFFGN